MKRILLSLIASVVLSYSVNSQIKILADGEVNLGKTNTTGLYYLRLNYTGYQGNNLAIYPNVNGIALLGKSGYGFNIVYTFSTQNPSDGRLKENVKNINNALFIVKKLQGIQYDYKMSTYIKDTTNITNNLKRNIDRSRKNYLGFIAQDVYKVLPQVVTLDDSTGLYSMDYSKIIPVLVEAIKEQQTQIEVLQKQVVKTSTLKSASATTDVTTTTTEVASLSQNAPNPFNQSTVIGYYLPESIQNAMLNIYDMNGVQIKTKSIIQKGQGNITIDGAELRPGMYYYTLIADGKEVDTKKMILTQ